MTVVPKQPDTGRGELRPSLLPFNPDELTAIRVRPAEFARLCGVSRQAVSKWVKRGIVVVGPDGRFDPVIAWRSVLDCSDPARLRARVFKDAIAPVAQLRARIRTLEAQVAALESQARGRSATSVAIDDVGELIDDALRELATYPEFRPRLDAFTEWIDARSEPMLFPTLAADSRETSPEAATSAPQAQTPTTAPMAQSPEGVSRCPRT